MLEELQACILALLQLAEDRRIVNAIGSGSDQDDAPGAGERSAAFESHSGAIGTRRQTRDQDVSARVEQVCWGLPGGARGGDRDPTDAGLAGAEWQSDGRIRRDSRQFGAWL